MRLQLASILLPMFVTAQLGFGAAAALTSSGAEAAEAEEDTGPGFFKKCYGANCLPAELVPDNYWGAVEILGAREVGELGKFAKLALNFQHGLAKDPYEGQQLVVDDPSGGVILAYLFRAMEPWLVQLGQGKLTKDDAEQLHTLWLRYSRGFVHSRLVACPFLEEKATSEEDPDLRADYKKAAHGLKLCIEILSKIEMFDRSEIKWPEKKADFASGILTDYDQGMATLESLKLTGEAHEDLVRLWQGWIVLSAAQLNMSEWTQNFWSLFEIGFESRGGCADAAPEEEEDDTSWADSLPGIRECGDGLWRPGVARSSVKIVFRGDGKLPWLESKDDGSRHPQGN